MRSPELPVADFTLSHSPEHLVTAVREVLSGRRVRGFIVEKHFFLSKLARAKRLFFV